MLNVLCDKNEGKSPGGRREDTCDHGMTLSRRSMRVKPPTRCSSWRVNVITTKNNNVCDEENENRVTDFSGSRVLMILSNIYFFFSFFFYPPADGEE